MRKKKLLFIINTLAGGGAEKVLVDLLNQMNPSKYEIDLLAVEDGVHAENLSKEIHYRCLLKKKNGICNRLLKKLVYHLPYGLFSKWFIGKTYDCEIAFLEGFPTRIVGSRSKAQKRVAVVHCNLSYDMIKGLYKTREDVYNEYLGFDHVVFVSESAKEVFEKEIGKLPNAIILRNAMNVPHIQELSMQKCPMRYATTGLKLISIGRLETVKGFDRLCDIVARMEKKYAFELWILGEGSQAKNLENRIQEQNIQSIKLLGYQNNPYAFLKQADLYVCASYAEGYSTVVKESLLCGTPVLTTDCGGMAEIVTSGENGYIVGNREEDLEAGLEKILSNDAFLAMLRVGALQYAEGCEWRQDIEAYEKLLGGEENV